MRKVPFVFCSLRNPQPLLPKIWKLHPSNIEQHWQLLDSRNKRQLSNTMDYSNKTFYTSVPPEMWFLSIGCVGDVPRISATNHHGHTGANSMELWKQRYAGLQKVWSRVIAAGVLDRMLLNMVQKFHCYLRVVFMCFTRQFQCALCMISFKYRRKNFYISQYLRRFQCIVIVIGNMNVGLMIIIMVRYWLNVINLIGTASFWR